MANLEKQLSQFHIVSIALQVMLLFIGALTLGIAGIGLMNIMLVAVQQRTKEIGIEKALGARKRHILIQFLAEALVITGIGGAAGIALAYAVSIGVGRITFYSALASHASDADIQLLISPAIVVLATGILVVVGVVSGMVPALKAANLNPIEALALRVTGLTASSFVAIHVGVRPFEYLEYRLARRPFGHPDRRAHNNAQFYAGKIDLVGPKDPGTHTLHLDLRVGKVSVYHHHKFIAAPPS